MGELCNLRTSAIELLGFIRVADAVIFIISSASISSPVCSWEMEQVVKLNKRLAPIVRERVADDRIPEVIAKINYLFFDQSDDFESQCNELVRALQTDLIWLKEHTRLGELARRWEERYPGVDIILIEPEPNDELMFQTSIMNYTSRVDIARHGFQSVTLKLAHDYPRFKRICARHGIEISATRVRKVVRHFEAEREKTRAWRKILEQTTSALLRQSGSAG